MGGKKVSGTQAAPFNPDFPVRNTECRIPGQLSDSFQAVDRCAHGCEFDMDIAGELLFEFGDDVRDAMRQIQEYRMRHRAISR